MDSIVHIYHGPVRTIRDPGNKYRLLNLDNLNSRIRYLHQFRALEKDRPEQPRTNPIRNLVQYLSSSSLNMVCLKDDVLIAQSLGIPLEKMLDEEVLLKERDAKRYRDMQTLYHSSLTVDRNHQGQGIGSYLAKAFKLEAKNRHHYDMIIGHAREGASLNIFENLGASIGKAFHDYGSTGETFYFYELDLRDGIYRIRDR